MPPRPVPYITDSTFGDVPKGFYPAADTDREQILVRTPGLLQFTALPDCTEIREIYWWGDYLYALARRGVDTVLWRVDESGGYSELGTITNNASGPAWMKNNPTQLGICTPPDLSIYTPSTNSFVAMTDPSFEGAGGFDYQDTYGMFFKPNTRQWYVTGIDNFLTIDSTQFYTKQTQTDNIVGLMSFMRQPLIMGAETGEWYHNTGGTDTSGATATFERDSGGLMEYGLESPKSLSNLAGIAPIWLTERNQLVVALGYSPVVVSTQMFTREVSGYSIKNDAVAFSYRDNGHVFYQITFPTADVSWVYDHTTSKPGNPMLHKIQSYKNDHSGWGRHRANCYSFHKGEHYVGDFSNGKIYKMSRDYYDDDGEEIRREIMTPAFEGGSRLLFFNPLELLMKVGVGTVTLDPQVMLYVSNDFVTFDEISWESAGKVGEYEKIRVIWEQMGASYRRQYKFAFTDPCAWEILGIDLGQ